MEKCRHQETCILHIRRSCRYCGADCWLAEKLDVVKLIDDEAARLSRELALHSVSKNGDARQGGEVPDVPE